jgi:hypothetical protein
VVVAEGELRLMMLGLASRAGDEACMFAPRAGDAEDERDRDTGSEDDAMTDEAGGETSACDGLRAGADEQAAPDTVTVESNRTVLTPSGPVELKVDVVFDAPGLGVAVDTGERDDEAAIPPKVGKELAAGVPEEDKGVEEMALEGTIPPKLNVFVGGKELNWRLFRLMMGGGTPGALRSMTGGEGAGPGGLRLMTGGLPVPCGPAIRPASEGLFRKMTLDDGAGFTPSGEITPRCIS